MKSPTVAVVENSTGRTLPVYNAIDASATATQLASINTSLRRFSVAVETIVVFAESKLFAAGS